MKARILAACAALALGTAPLLAVTDASAAGTAAFDAYSMHGDASCLAMTVKSGYSFVFEPDARLPRALAEMDAQQSRALASPADPGDSVDGLAGLLIPEVAGKLEAQPAPVNSAGTVLATNPADPALEYPIEHASASYPDPQHPGDQTRTFAGAPDAVASDPTGAVSVDAGLGRATAGAQSASADAGYGAATSVPLVGLTVGRVDAHSTAQLLGDRVVEDSACTLDNLTITPPGMAPLHIGSLTATLHTERDSGGAPATARHQLTLSDVTVGGQAVTITPSGLTLPSGKAISWPPAPVSSVTVPGAGPVPATTASLAGTAYTQTASSGGAEMSLAMTAATITLRSALPVPNAVPPSGVSPTPSVITLRLADMTSSAYGASLPQLPGVGASAFGTGSLGSNVAIPGSAGSAGSPGSAGLGAGSAELASTRWPAAIARWLVILIAALSELCLLGALYRAWRRSRTPATADDGVPWEMV